MNFLQRTFVMVALAGLVVLAGCSEDPPLPDNITEFESNALGFASAEQELTINFKLTREVETDASINVQLEPSGVVYGTDFTTEPAASGNAVVIAVPAGATTASFKVKKAANRILTGEEKIAFTITSLSDVLVLGEKSALTVSFAEIIAQSGTMEVSGGGTNFTNKVFIDFSANRQTAVDRSRWDLGFSTADDFRVILNSSNGMMARMINKTDLNAVTAADTLGMGIQLGVPQIFAAINQATTPAWTSEAVKWIDDPTGDWTKTAIAAVSATESENKVYIINRGQLPGSTTASGGWKKIRVLRNGNNYVLQHADIAATSFTTVNITKSTANRFDYVSFATGVVSVEPAKTKWDIAWTGFTNTTNFGSGPVPYYFQDVILQNTSGVQAVQVLNSSIAYDAFSEANLSALTLSSSQVTIGSSWRSGGGPGVSPAVRTDRYYIVKDADGNVYKVRFTALTTNGERGKPQLQYALVKKAA